MPKAQSPTEPAIEPALRDHMRFGVVISFEVALGVEVLLVSKMATSWNLDKSTFRAFVGK